MGAFKNEKNGTWYVQFRYTDWQGLRQQKLKRGFATKREAQEWERAFLTEKKADVTMPFKTFTELYEKDVRPKLKENTWLTKEHIIQTKILPYFEHKRLCDISSKDVIAWQNEIRKMTNSSGEPLSQGYLKTIHNQLSALFNHAIKIYGLRLNPASTVGNMGKEERKEMSYWTVEEYSKFSDEMMDKPLSYYAFQMLYWTGIRVGELLALTAGDFDFKNNMLTINKSYQRLHGEDVITPPKTEKSNRTIKMPQFLCDEMQEYLKMFYSPNDSDRIFPISKSYLHHEMDRGSKAAGVKRIRIHDLRHSHVSLLINQGYQAAAIADRVGHETVEITDRYTHIYPSKQNEMANTLDELWKEKNNMSLKNKDEHNRWRNKTVAFRVSPEEWEQIERYVQLSGLTKQDYITRRLINKEVVVQGNPRVYKALRNNLADVLTELQRIENSGSVNDELLDLIKMIADILGGLKEASE